MALEIDTSRAFFSLAMRRALIVAVHEAPLDESEPDWIEWKSEVDLREKRWMAEIARQVIGLANRDPDKAHRAAEGSGYLLLGVEPGNLCGVTPIDNAQLESGVSAYLGRDGPQMSPEYLDVNGKNVLVMSVRPPRQGDRIYCFEKEYQRLAEPRVHYRNGDVFVRRDGRTVPAEAADFRMLERRLLERPVQQQLDVELRWARAESAVIPIDVSDAGVEAWVARERERLRRPPDPGPAIQPSLATPKAHVPMTVQRLERQLLGSKVEPETRTAEQYDSEVEKYLAAVQSGLPNYLRYRAVEDGLGVLQLAAVNNTEDNYEEVAIVLSFGGVISAFFDEDGARYDLDPVLPRPPRRWGPKRKPLYPRLLGRLNTPSIPPHALMPRATPRRGRIDNSGSARIAFEPFHLRPGYTVPLPEVHLVVPAVEADAAQVTGTWSATSTSLSGSASGTLQVHLKQPVSVEELLKK
jgi:hypothetical protein